MNRLGATSVQPIRLVLADDHPIVLAGLAQLFAWEPGFCVVAAAATGREVLEAVHTEHPDVLVLDMRLPDKDGIDVLRELQRPGSSTRVVILTAAESPEVLEAIRMGVHGVVLKDMMLELLVRCVRAVHAGNKWIEKSLATRALDQLLVRRSGERDLATTLTVRELEVARLIAQGYSNKVVAARLSITEGTVKLHVHHVYGKLELEGRMALSQYLRSKGVVE